MVKFEKTAFFNDLSSRFSPTLSSNINNLLDYLKVKLEVCIPAIVYSVDRKKSMVIVELAPNTVFADGKTQKRGLVKVPIIVNSGGGYMINYPIEKGDVGWVIAGDRDTTGYREDNSQTYNLKSIGNHSYSYGFFIPDVYSNVNKTFKLTEEDEDKLVIQTLNGNTKIRLSKDGVIDIICPDTLNIIGDIKVTGGITATEDIVAGTISLKTHIHSGVTSGESNTGVPNT